MSNFTEAKDLPANEKQALTELRAGIMWSQGFFSHILLDKCQLVATRDVPYAATDGHKIFVNPTKFAELTLQQRIYILTHEICHVMYEHCEQSFAMSKQGGIMTPRGMLSYDNELRNIAQDYSINALLDECKIGERPPEGMFSNRYKGGESWVKIYDELHRDKEKNQNQPQGSGGGGSNPGSGPGNNPSNKPFDQHLDPGSQSDMTPQQAVQDRADKAMDWQQTINQAAAVAKSRGELPAALQRLVNDVVEPKVDWKDKLASSITRRIGGGGYDWTRCARSGIVRPDQVYIPARSGKGTGCVVVIGDTSGSVGDREMAIVAGTMGGIFDQAMPRKAWVIWCDAKVHLVEELESPDDVAAIDACKRAKGGGGTRFAPAFEKIEELGIVPDAVVYVTDLHGSFPEKEPPYPVIWAVVPNGAKQAPFGEVIQMEV